MHRAPIQSRKNRLVILAALDREAQAAAAACAIPFVRDAALKSPASVEIHTIGMRAVRLASALGSLDLASADSVWMVGLAGALDPTLQVGDVVIDDDPAGPPLQLEHTTTVRRGRIHTSDRLIVSAAEKRALFAQTAAVAVDMEQQIVRGSLAPMGISVVGIRAISDAADTSMDPVLPRLVDPIGRPRWSFLAAELLRRPALGISLIRLGRNSRHAIRQLTRAVTRLAELNHAVPD